MMYTVVLDMPKIRTRGNLVLARGHPCGWSSQDLSSSASVEPACSLLGLVAATIRGCRPATRALTHKTLTTKLLKLDLPNGKSYYIHFSYMQDKTMDTEMLCT